MHQHVTTTSHDIMLPLPHETATTGTVDGALDYRELLLQDGTSIFIPTDDDYMPID